MNKIKLFKDQSDLEIVLTNDDIINNHIAKMFNLCERNRQSTRFSIRNSEEERQRAVDELKRELRKKDNVHQVNFQQNQ